MAYDKQIKCSSCGMSIPDVHENADAEALLCNRCHKLKEVDDARKADLWGEYEEYPVLEWQNTVVNGDTRSGYWSWVEAQVESES